MLVHIHSCVNMSNNRIDKYLVKAGNTWESMCTLSISQLAPLSNCHLVAWIAILFNLYINLRRSRDCLCVSVAAGVGSCCRCL